VQASLPALKVAAFARLERGQPGWLIRMTFGVTAYEPPMTTDQCIRLADEAMLQGKRRGKNCVVARRFRQTTSR